MIPSARRQTTYYPLERREFMSQGNGGDEEGGHSKVDNYDPKTPAMKSWKKKYLVEEESEIEEELEEELSPAKEASDADKQFTTFCLVLITMSIGGSIFSMIGYYVGPESCDNDSIFEILGVFAFSLSMMAGIPVNIIIWLLSLTNPEFNSKNVLLLFTVHAAITLLCGIAFNGYLLQDMFCNGGPGFYVTASPI